MINIENVKNILLKEKIVYFNKKDSSKLIFNPNTFKKYNTKYWEDIENILSNKYSELKEFFNNFRHNHREIVYCLNQGLIEPPTCPFCNERHLLFKERGKTNDKYYKTCGNKECISKSVEEYSLEHYGTSHPLASNILIEKRKSTNIEKYGVDNPMKNKKIVQKAKQTNIKKYGVSSYTQTEEYKEKTIATNRVKYGTDWVLQNENIKEKGKESNKEKYGVEYASQSKEIQDKMKQTNKEKYNVDYYSQTKEWKEKIEKTQTERYGVPYYTQTEEYKERVKNTNMEKYGVSSYTQTEECKEKIKDTNQKTYGVEWALQSPIIQEKVKQTMNKKYGVDNPSQVKEFQDKKSKKYLYNNIHFDSSYELAFYIYLQDHYNQDEFEYHPSELEYKDIEGNSHKYYPDFKIKDQLIEIKGEHMLNENKELIDFYGKDKNQDIYFCKQKCMEENKVKLITKDDLENVFNYVKTTYGSNYLTSFKIK